MIESRPRSVVDQKVIEALATEGTLVRLELLFQSVVATPHLAEKQRVEQLRGRDNLVECLTISWRKLRQVGSKNGWREAGNLLRKVLVGGTDISRIKESELGRLRSGTVASLLQGATRNLLPYATPEENVTFARKALTPAARRRLPAPDALLDALGMGDLTGRPLSGMSGGEKQRVAFASAVSSGAGLLLADEPTSQLSHDDRDAMVELIHVVNREFGTTVVLVTHDPEVAAQMPRSITIRNGRIGSEGRRGFDFGVVDEDGAVHIPDDLATRFPAGTLVQFEDTPEGGTTAVVSLGIAS